MSMQSVIENKVVNAFKPDFIEVSNESHLHNVPKGSESHFKLVVISDLFAQKSLVTRHKMIYQLLDQELKSGVHAIALHTFTTEEYMKKHGKVPDSPLCHGGGKVESGH